MYARNFDNVRKDLDYPAMSPRPHLHFSGDHALLMVFHVHHAHLRITCAPFTSDSDKKTSGTFMRHKKMSIERYDKVEN